MKRILVVDDEQAIADLVELYLKNEGYEVVKFYSGQATLDFLSQHQVDLAILDIMLPDIDGFVISQKIREQAHFPIIMLTAKDQELDKITGLTLGADDYVTKPFQPLELVARVKAQLRRYTMYNEGQSKEVDQLADQVIYHKSLVVNKTTYEVTVNQKPVELTPTEFKILWVLLEHVGKVLRSEELFHLVWGEKYFESSNNTVMVHIRHLRSKIEGPNGNQKYIKTVWGVGYKLD
ncbi:VanR-ABDEGLN family response regulator transcription factor [Vagococcus sp. BWB3-3]|uniref:VanR-ABDEGLN family response regulator transcription factor n=1 Tax=Vagococcus allomyrinae TaxID=2794353 RepID=A0A940PFB7_9ENTE|nr:VanR-ABDEGLN family response regulator transcription factor [Vagococcus allomyrinae]MBP1041783.1 VanR-ABDEGLN family response regulator transcription factor [Vagococcus allomyrinae]